MLNYISSDRSRADKYSSYFSSYSDPELISAQIISVHTGPGLIRAQAISVLTGPAGLIHKCSSYSLLVLTSRVLTTALAISVLAGLGLIKKKLSYASAYRSMAGSS